MYGNSGIHYLIISASFAYFSSELCELCTEQLNEALEMMNRAVVSSQSQPGARENVAYLTSTERRRDFEPVTQQVIFSIKLLCDEQSWVFLHFLDCLVSVIAVVWPEFFCICHRKIRYISVLLN